MIKTALTELLGIRYPVVQGGMAWVATWELVTAVSEGGGLGIIGAGNAPTDWVAEQIAQVKAHTKAPYGLNVPLFSPCADEVIALCIKERVPVVTTGAGNPTPYIAPLKAAGTTVIPVVAAAAFARRLVRAGADAVIAEGLDSGGHIGAVTTMGLVPAVVDAVDVPVIAAGAMSDGRGLAAALAMGADGVQMGTRFICADECIAHDNYKQAIVKANERSTMVTGNSIGHPVRCLRNPMARDFAEMEKRGVSEQEVIEFGTGRLRLAATEGDVTHGSLMAGQGAALIHEVLPAAEIILQIMAEAEASLARLATLTAASEG